MSSLILRYLSSDSGLWPAESSASMSGLSQPFKPFLRSVWRKGEDKCLLLFTYCAFIWLKMYQEALELKQWVDSSFSHHLIISAVTIFCSDTLTPGNYLNTSSTAHIDQTSHFVKKRRDVNTRGRRLIRYRISESRTAVNIKHNTYKTIQYACLKWVFIVFMYLVNI